jgi:SAM-dependent methyltransferase
LRRCRSCRLTFRVEPADEIVDERLDRDELVRLGEGRRLLYEAALEGLRRERQLGTLLDVGCGSGEFARMASRDGWRVTALDSSAYLCDQARGLGTAGVVRAVAQSLPFQARQFDVLTLWDVIDHLDRPIPALMEARRVLRPGGLLHVRVRNGPVHLALRRNVLIPTAASVVHNLLFSGGSLATALRLSGFVGITTDSAPLTRGNPYARSAHPGERTFRAFKTVWSASARIASRLTSRHLLIAPSIQARARRPSA